MRAFILDGESVRETSDTAQLRTAAADDKTMWIDLETQSREVDALLETLGLHPLTIEDIWSDRPSPKADEFPEYLYVCAHTVKRSEAGEMQTCEIDLVVAKTFVITHDTM